MDYAKQITELLKPIMVDGAYVVDHSRREAADAIIELLERATEAENERDKLKAIFGPVKSLGADNQIENSEDKFINLQDALRIIDKAEPDVYEEYIDSDGFDYYESGFSRDRIKEIFDLMPAADVILKGERNEA